MELSDPFVRKLKAVIDADVDLTVAGVAKAAGLSDSTIRRAIELDGGMSTKSQAKIVKVFSMTVAEFMADGFPDSTDVRLRKLYAQLESDERHQLLGFGEGLLAKRDPAPE